MASLAFVPRKLRAKTAGGGANFRPGAGRQQQGVAGNDSTSSIQVHSGGGTSRTFHEPSTSSIPSRVPSGLVLKIWIGSSLRAAKEAGCSEADIVATVTSAAERLRGHSVAYVDLASQGDKDVKAMEGLQSEWIHIRCQSSSAALSLVHALNQKPRTIPGALLAMSKLEDQDMGRQDAEVTSESWHPPPVVAIKPSRIEEERYWDALPARAKRAAIKMRRRTSNDVKGIVLQKDEVRSKEQREGRPRKRRVKRRRRERNELRTAKRRQRTISSGMEVV